MSGSLYLSTVTFGEQWRCFDADTTFELRAGVNVLVGDQGSGKSSLLTAIIDSAGTAAKKPGPAKVTLGPDASPDVQVLSFDFERDNPRLRSWFDNDHGSMVAQIQSHFASHGEVVNSILDGTLTRAADKPTLLLLDEPDMALSPRSAHRLAATFTALAEGGAQVIASVHNPIVIAAFDDVYDLETRAWTTSAAYLEAAARPAKKKPTRKRATTTRKAAAKRPARSTR